MQHVATWKEGDEKWAYHEDAFAHIATHKVSLDPYRLESRRILACIKDVLPPTQRVEKASVDEVFLDLSAQIHDIMLQRYPEISRPAPYDDPTEPLPRPPTTALDWNTDALVDLDGNETEDDDPDWDDIAILIGSEIIRLVRAAIQERLRYTCSAGIARNKMIAKLGSAHKKPNQQTIVRNRAIQEFLGNYKFTKIRNLGGKLGEDIVAKFGTDQVKGLREVSLGQLKSKLGDDTGSWVHEVIRGDDLSEVNSRTQIKSMLSAKSFRPTINSFEQAVKWLRIFVADIFSRLIEEGVLENKRRPKTINLHHRQGGQMRSRQAPIPSGRPINESTLFDISKSLLSQVIVHGRAWPCANLRLSVGSFEEGPTGTRGIGGFLVRGEEAKAIKYAVQDVEEQGPDESDHRPEKRPKTGHGQIQRFLSKQETSREDSEEYSSPESDEPIGSTSLEKIQNAAPFGDTTNQPHSSCHEIGKTKQTRKRLHKINTGLTARESSPLPYQATLESYFCNECQQILASASREEHEDWHFAKSIQAEETDRLPYKASSCNAKTKGSVVTKKSGESKVHSSSALKRVEKGQSRLAFGGG